MEYNISISSSFSNLLLSWLAPQIHSPQTNRFTSSSSLSTKASITTTNTLNSGSAILWFKHDLRVDDHPGLLQAATCPALAPLYVFDHRILSSYSGDMLELVLFALEDLRKSLKEQGSNLMIRFGSAENVIRDLVQEVKATYVFAEEEVEYHLRQTMCTVEESWQEQLSLRCSVLRIGPDQPIQPEKLGIGP